MKIIQKIIKAFDAFVLKLKKVFGLSTPVKSVEPTVETRQDKIFKRYKELMIFMEKPNEFAVSDSLRKANLKHIRTFKRHQAPMFVDVENINEHNLNQSNDGVTLEALKVLDASKAHKSSNIYHYVPNSINPKYVVSTNLSPVYKPEDSHD